MRLLTSVCILEVNELKEDVVTNEPVSIVAVTPVKPLPSPKNDPLKDPLLYEPVKALNELVVTNEPVSNEPEPAGPVGPAGPAGPGIATCITLVTG